MLFASMAHAVGLMLCHHRCARCTAVLHNV